MTNLVHIFSYLFINDYMLKLINQLQHADYAHLSEGGIPIARFAPVNEIFQRVNGLFLV